MSNRSRPLISAGLLLGIGLGGFFDGILFHQILQAHNMLSNRLVRTSLVNLEINMFWDGMFHAFTWITTVIGLTLLWRAGKSGRIAWSNRVFAGALLLGWGVFNFVEGLIDHQLLALHHVIQNAASHWPGDLAFLASGVALMGAGGYLISSDKPKVTVERHESAA